MSRVRNIAMGTIAIERIKREFKEVIKSEEASFCSITYSFYQ
jgi:hypothetical protein